MPLRAILFDFHNTLVAGDSWLRLEIHTLPREVLGMLVRDDVLPGAGVTPELLDRADTLYKEVREEAKSSGLEVDAVTGARRVLDQLGLHDIPDAAVEQAVEEAEHGCLAETVEIPNVRAAVEALSAQGLKLGVVSSAAFSRFVLWGLEQHDLARYFSVVATSADTGYYKSDPRLYHWALDQLGASAAEAVHVGDHLRFDVEGAQAAGLRAVWYNPQNASPEITHPDSTVTDMRDLPSAIATLND